MRWALTGSKIIMLLFSRILFASIGVMKGEQFPGEASEPIAGHPEELRGYPAAAISHSLESIDRVVGPDITELRTRMIDALRSGAGMQAVFPEISAATARFLGVHTEIEIDQAAQIARQQELCKDLPQFATILCEPLSDSQKADFQRRLTRMAVTQQQLLLRYCSGETVASVATADKLTLGNLNKRFVLMSKRWLGTEEEAAGGEELLVQTKRIFPARAYSIASNLLPHLKRLDQEVSLFAQRTITKTGDDRDFVYVAQTCKESDLTAEEMAILFTGLNHHSMSPRDPDYKQAQFSTTRIKYKRFKHVVAAFDTRYRSTKHDPRETVNIIYEDTEEATETIKQALENGALPIPTKQEVIEAAKEIEVGVTAAHALLHTHKTADALTRQDLESFAAIGNEAIQFLLRTHIRLVQKIADQQHRSLSSELPFEDLVFMGMRGLLRSIRKYDYKKDFVLTTPSYYWIRSRIKRQIFREDWQMPEEKANVAVTLREVHKELYGQLSRAPTVAELAAEMFQPKELIAELLPLALRIGVHESQKTLPMWEGDRYKYMASSAARAEEFDADSRQLLEQFFAEQPLHLAVLQDFITKQHTDAEIAVDLQLSTEQVAAYRQEAFTALQATFSREELTKLLAGN